jgi:periodic tryptophan protein 2
MKTDFKVSFFLSLLATAILTQSQFSNLLGTVYRKGNLLFTPDGNCLLSPVGNRVTVFDLVQYVRSLRCYGILVEFFELTEWPC